MSWISKNLTLDLIAIAVDALSKTFERIKAEPDGGWPPAEPAPVPVLAETPTAPSAEVKQEPAQEDPTPAPVSGADPSELHSQAQLLLRGISLDEGPDWITGVLFPHFEIASLTELPADRLPELIAMAQAHVDQKEAA